MYVFDLCHVDLLERGCTNSVVGLELAEIARFELLYDYRVAVSPIQYH